MLLSRRQRHCLHYMGVELWVERAASAHPARRDAESMAPARDAGHIKDNVDLIKTVAGPGAQDADPNVAAPGGNRNEAQWRALRGEVADCRLCPLHKSRTQTVFGVGDIGADWLLIGEAPGAQEDRQGEPFVGRAGKLLDSMLYAMGLQREQVFIANILKCRPPSNRDPEPDEIASCENYLKRQVGLLQPRIILALGRVAAQQLLKVDTPIGKLRGQTHHYQAGERNIPLVVSWHPAYLLRRPAEKARAWLDLQDAMRLFEEHS